MLRGIRGWTAARPFLILAINTPLSTALQALGWSRWYGVSTVRNPVTAGLFSSPAPHQNTEPPSPEPFLLITTTTEILKESRGQYTSRQFSSHELIPMTTQFIELATINDQELQAAAGGFLRSLMRAGKTVGTQAAKHRKQIETAIDIADVVMDGDN